MDDILAAFAIESAEMLEGMESSILALERGEAGSIESLFRAVHTLKGSAGIVGLARLERYAHQLENRLGRMRSGASSAGGGCFGALLSCRDRCSAILAEAAPGDGLLEADEASLAALDATLISGPAPTAEPDGAPVPAHGEPPPAPGEPPSAERRPEAPGASGTGREPRAAAPQEAPAPPAQAEAGQRTVRIADAKLDVLLNLASELVTVQAQLSQTAAEAGDRRFIGIAESVRRLVAELRTTAMEMRLVRVDGLFSRYGRMVRDVSSGLGKEVELLTEGGHTELDKNAVEGLVDPLMHLIRNAVDHGIEAPADRERAGKPRTGSVRLSARHDGGSVVIRVSDDGRGIDWDRVAAIAVERGLAPPGGKPSPEELEDMLFAPGFSTQAEVSNVSGRGVGLDVVKTAIERLGGGVEISSAKGSGTEFSLSIPLTIAIIDGFLAVSGRRSFIVPLANVLECFERKRGDGVERLIERSGGLVPIVDVRKRFSVDEPPVGDTEAVLVVSVGSGRIALAFDSIVGGYQTVIKPLGELARYAREVAGAAILADGSIALILDVTSIAKSLKDD